MRRAVLLTILTGVCVSPPLVGSAMAAGDERVKPWSKNVRYWQYQGEPMLLLGGSKDDNLFQIPDLEEHLDLLARVGGNYIRNTMSARGDKGHEVQAFKRLPNGKYDLDQWNEEYWRRLESLLRLTRRRGVIVQIEVWDRFDYTDAKAINYWQASPYRPANNVTYTGEETGLADRYPDHPSRDRQPFFHTIPGMDKYRRKYDTIRKVQERFVGKMLSYSLDYPNVLYCMNNETSTHPKWGRYWMKLIRKQAAAKGVGVCATDMFDDGWEPERSEKIRLELDNPKTYQFIEISQVNSRNFGEDHWRRMLWVVQQVKRHPRPINHTKIYGDGNTRWGSGLPKDGVERFWRNILAGSASSRFHRDGAGTGLQPISQASIRAARKLESLIKLWDVEPRNDLLEDRKENEAYLAAAPGRLYALYFTDGGSVGLDLRKAKGTFRLKWIEVATGEWGPEATINSGRVVPIDAPAKHGWVAAIRKP